MPGFSIGCVLRLDLVVVRSAESEPWSVWVRALSLGGATGGRASVCSISCSSTSHAAPASPAEYTAEAVRFGVYCPAHVAVHASELHDEGLLSAPSRRRL